MLDCLGNMKFRLFGSERNIEFDDSKSLYDNFINMCSLPFYNSRSNQTLELMKRLKDCELGRDRDTNIARLQYAITAVEYWMGIRSLLSTRTRLVNTFLSKLRHKQNYLLGSAQNETRVNGRRGSQAYVNPLFKLEAYLGETQVAFINERKSDPGSETTPLLKKSTTKNFLMAAFMPFINLGIDFDCFNCMLDSFNSCLNMANLF